MATSEDQTQHPIVEVTTNKGTFRAELFPEAAPQHVQRFLERAGDGFYDDLHFHRVVPGFVAQTGDPLTKGNARHPRAGTGGPGYTIAAEFNELPHLRGTLGMARSADPNSAGSQFYICLADTPHLDRQYTVFGRVLDDGMAVVDQIGVGDAMEKVRVVSS